MYRRKLAWIIVGTVALVGAGLMVLAPFISDAQLGSIVTNLATHAEVLAPGAADFTSSYKTGPPSALKNDVITYTIVAVNTGDAVSDVTLSDAIPNSSTFVPGSCTYDDGNWVWDCGPLTEMWVENFAPGDRITTTFAARVTAGTMMWPLVNCAYLNWDSNQQEMCFTTIVNPFGNYTYLPLVLCNYPTCFPQLVAEIAAGPEAYGVALDTAGQRAFVAHADGVAVIDTASMTVITDIPTPAHAFAIAYDPNHNRIWVTRSDANRVAVLDGETFATLADLPTDDGARSVAYNPANDRVYVSNFGSDTVSVYDATNLALDRRLHNFTEPSHIAVNPVTNKIYVANHGLHGQVTRIRGDTHETARVNASLFDAFGITVDTTRNLVYVTSIAEARLSVIDGSTDELLGIMDVRYDDGEKPALWAITVNPNVGPEGHLFLVASTVFGRYDQLLVIPNGWPTLGDPVPLNIASYPQEGIALDPDRDRIWVTSVASGLVSVVQDGDPVCVTSGGE